VHQVGCKISILYHDARSKMYKSIVCCQGSISHTCCGHSCDHPEGGALQRMDMLQKCVNQYSTLSVLHLFIGSHTFVIARHLFFLMKVPEDGHKRDRNK
jgi:hypothetical protein